MHRRFPDDSSARRWRYDVRLIPPLALSTSPAADQDIGRRVDGHYRRGDRLDFRELRDQPMHFPVTGDQGRIGSAHNL